METLLQAIALVLAMEGIGFALFPNGVSKALGEMSRLPLSCLRMLGACALILSTLAGLLARAIR